MNLNLSADLEGAAWEINAASCTGYGLTAYTTDPTVADSWVGRFPGR